MAQSTQNQVINSILKAKEDGKFYDVEIVEQERKVFFEDLVGVSIDGSVYHWISITQFHDSETCHVSFKETYSRNTGQAKRGIRHGFRIIDSLSDRIGLSLK